MSYKEKYNLLMDIIETIATGGKVSVGYDTSIEADVEFLTITDISGIYLLKQLTENGLITVLEVWLDDSNPECGSSCIELNRDGEIISD